MGVAEALRRDKVKWGRSSATDHFAVEPTHCGERLRNYKEAMLMLKHRLFDQIIFRFSEGNGDGFPMALRYVHSISTCFCLMERIWVWASLRTFLLAYVI